MRAGPLCLEKMVEVQGRRQGICDFLQTLFIIKRTGKEVMNFEYGKNLGNYNNSGILLPKLFWPTVRKNCSSDQEKLLKFEAEGREFAKCLRSLEQFIQTGQSKLFQLVPGGFSYLTN